VSPEAVAKDRSASDPAAKDAPASKAAGAAAATTRLGDPITEHPVALSEIAKHPGAYEDKVVATTGTVTAVCQSMGCWMEIKDSASEAHVKLAGHKFFVPKSSSGHTARVQGKVIKVDPTDECVQEAAEQTGKPIAKLQLVATGVELD